MYTAGSHFSGDNVQQCLLGLPEDAGAGAAFNGVLTHTINSLSGHNESLLLHCSGPGLPPGL